MNNTGGGSRRDWEGHGAASSNSYPSGPPDFTKPGSGAPDFSRTTTSTSESYSSSSTGMPQDGSQAFQSDQFGSEMRDQPTGLMGQVAAATDTAKVAAMSAFEGSKNLARQASESAKSLATGAWYVG